MRITGEEWGAMKAAATYGDAQLPIYVKDDGTYMTQSMAILRSLAMEHGYGCESADVMFETEWFFSMLYDTFEKPERFAILKDAATEEDMDKCIALFEAVLDKLEARWADGRTSVGKSEGKTAADFCWLSLMTSHFENAGLKHQKIVAACAAKVAACPNIIRITAPMKDLCRATIDAMASSII